MIKFAGNNDLITNPANNDDEPIIKHKRFSWKLSSTVFIDFPPYLIIVN